MKGGVMDQEDFFQALTRYHKGHREPLLETTAVLSYEVGRMMEQAMFMKWHPADYAAHVGFFKSELMDAIAQCVLLCESLSVDFEEWKEMGIEKAMERFTGKEVKR
jgi:NTP pyrophosphatase (non-canonical NTP hydrolase)